jgi:hypothetical protein
MQGFRRRPGLSTASVFEVESTELLSLAPVRCHGSSRCRRQAGPFGDVNLTGSPVAQKSKSQKPLSGAPPVEIERLLKRSFIARRRVIMQRRSAPARIITRAVDPLMLINDLTNARMQRQQKLIAAIMAHPSYKAAGPESQTTGEGRSC